LRNILRVKNQINLIFNAVKKIMRIFKLLFVILITVSAFLPVSAQSKEFPATAFGKLVQEFMKLVDSGTEAEMKTFVENNFSTEGIRSESVTETVFIMQKLQKQSGGLEILSVAPPNGPYGMTMKVKAKRGAHYATIAVGEDSREPGKIIGFGIWKENAPNKQTKINWEEKPLSESEMIEEIRRQVARRAAEGNFSGVVLIAKDDKILLHVAHGLAERSFNVPNNLNTKFNLASVGKMFTATAIALLVKQGKISYDEKLIKYLPDFPNKEAAEKITIHQLLTHTAGMGTLFESPHYERLRRYRSSWDEVSAFSDEKLFFEPGTDWRYSNAGYVTLAAIIERVSGMNYVDYVRENIFKPLGMKDTDSYPHDEVVPNMSVLYVQSPDDPLGIEPYVADHVLAGYRGSGEGGGYSTALDLLKFARSYRTGKLLGKETQEFIATPKVDDNRDGTNDYGYGVRQSIVNGEIVRGHSGGGRTHLQMLWNSGYTVIVQTNTVPPPVTALSSEIVGFMTKQISMRDKK
jgi:CubicO group peptidase (beta-lactamase class C family)